MIDEVFDLRAVLAGLAVARGVGNVDHRAGRDDRSDHAGEVFRIGARRLRRRTRRPRRSAWRISPASTADSMIFSASSAVCRRYAGAIRADSGRVCMRLCLANRRASAAKRRCLFTARVGELFRRSSGPKRPSGNFRFGLKSQGLEIIWRIPLDDVHAETFEEFGDFELLRW